jgi:hypothetical protein
MADSSDEHQQLPWQTKLIVDVAVIKKGVSTLEGNIQRIQSEMVRQADCSQHMERVSDRVTEALGKSGEAATKAEKAYDEVTARHDIAQLKAGARTSTGTVYEAVRPSGPLMSPGGSWWSRLSETAKGLSSIITLIVLAGGLILALSHFVARVETALKHADEVGEKTQRAISKAGLHDSGPSPAALKRAK